MPTEIVIAYVFSAFSLVLSIASWVAYFAAIRKEKKTNDKMMTLTEAVALFNYGARDEAEALLVKAYARWREK
jgi:hypothetical protein